MSKRRYPLFLLLLILFGCVKEEMHNIVFSKSFLAATEHTQESFSKELKKDGLYEEVAHEDDGSVVLVINSIQKEYWVNNCKDLLSQLNRKISSVNKEYKVEISKDYDVFDFYFNLNLPERDARKYIKEAIIYGSMMQLLEENAENMRQVIINIYNSDNDKLVTSGTGDTGVSYTKEDWKTSAKKES